MKSLLILRGCPGSGKTTLLEDLGLDIYSLSSDKLRLMYSSPVLNEEGNYTISQDCNNEVFDTLYKMLEYRMANGEFTVIDATHCSSHKTVQNQIQEYRRLAKRYNYRIYQYDMTMDLLKIARQNEYRRGTYSFVPHHIVDKMYKVMKDTPKLHRDITKIDSLEDFISSYNTDYLCDANVYTSVKVIGDIHSCNTVLKNALSDFDINTLYVFVGDYFDRGIEHYDTLKTIQDLSKHKNVVLLEGNHESHWIRYAHSENGDDLGYKRFRETTLKDWLLHYDNESDLKKELRILYRKLHSCYFFKCGNFRYMVTHAGLTKFPENALLLSSTQCVKGVGGYDFEVSLEYTKQQRSGTEVQVFGHRGVSSSKGFSYSLEGKVEFGGHLKVLNIDKSGQKVVEYKNYVYNKNYLDDEFKFQQEFGKVVLNTDSIEVNVIANSRLVKVRNCGDMVSLNFTEKAFRHNLWDSVTIKARGLFVDKITGNVKARSYDKFFNLGQREDSNGELDKLVYPVRVAKKENGSLGIISWDRQKGEYIFASKNSTMTEHAGYVKENFEMVDFNIQYALRTILMKYNCSAVFEMIHPKDVHIINYNKSHKLFLLDFVPNKLHLDNGIHIDYEFSEMCRKEFSKIYEENPMLAFDDVFKVVWSTTVSDRVALDVYLEKAKTCDFEGYVFTDARGYMTKIKSDSYLEWKYCRTLLGHYVSNSDINTNFLNDFEKSFYSFLRTHFVSDLRDKNILEVRDMYNQWVANK